MGQNHLVLWSPIRINMHHIGTLLNSLCLCYPVIYIPVDSFICDSPYVFESTAKKTEITSLFAIWQTAEKERPEEQSYVIITNSLNRQFQDQITFYCLNDLLLCLLILCKVLWKACQLKRRIKMH